jgi:methionyl-tRNA formyltransferase
MGLSIVFMGTPDFARSSLEALLASSHRVVAVVSQPDRRQGRGQQVKSPPVAELAKERGLPLLQVESAGTAEFRKWVKSFEPDLAVVAAFGHILGPKALSTPRLGCVNVHASLLPRWRGASPIAMAVLAGDAEAGVAIMQMDVGMDTGGVFAMRGLPVENTDTGESLHDKLATQGGALLVETLDRIENGEAQATPQTDEGVTFAPLLGKDDGALDWNEPAVNLERRIRAFHPWPGTFARLDGKTWRIMPGATVEVAASGVKTAPGTIIEARKARLVVACGEGALALGTVQLEGKKALPVQSFLAGMPELLGMRFEPRASKT